MKQKNLWLALFGGLAMTAMLTACGGGTTEDAVKEAAKEAGLSEEEINNIVSTLESYQEEYVAEDMDVETLSEDSSIDTKIADVFASTEGSIEACLGLLPAKPAAMNDPGCYGPVVDYKDHPDYMAPSNQNNQNNQNNMHQPSADGQLPIGDTGILVADAADGQACSAAKMDKEMAVLQYKANLAKGASAFVGCVAAYNQKTLPTASSGEMTLAGEELNVGSGFTGKLMSLKQELDGSDKVNIARVVGSFSDDDKDRAFALLSKHYPMANSASRGGFLLVQKAENGDISVSSIRYNSDGSNSYYRSISGDLQPNGQIFNKFDQLLENQKNFNQLMNDTSIFDSNRELVIYGDQGWNNIVAAKATESDSALRLAYGWNAGGGDDAKRVFNVKVDKANDTGKAMYGYVKNAQENNSQVTKAGMLNINLLSTSAESGMICNWAGPNNSHTPSDYVQYQEMALSSGKWTATQSNIDYVMTKACDWSGVNLQDTSEFSWQVDGTTTTIKKTDADATNYLDLVSKSNVTWWQNPKQSDIN